MEKKDLYESLYIIWKPKHYFAYKKMIKLLNRVGIGVSKRFRSYHGFKYAYAFLLRNGGFSFIYSECDVKNYCEFAHGKQIKAKKLINELKNMCKTK